MRKNGTLYYLLGDHLGSTSITLNSSGSKIAVLRYKACPLRFTSGVLREGEMRYTSGTTYTAYQFREAPFRGTGQRNETSLGLYFYREASRRDNARWPRSVPEAQQRGYDPSLGRFTSADTLVPGGVQGYDRYAYTSNNPVKYVDPSGHNWEDCGNRNGYRCKIHLKHVQRAKDRWAAEAAATSNGMDDCRNLTCDSGISNWGNTSAGLDYTGYNAWERRILQELYNTGNSDAIHGVLYILEHGIHITVKWGWQAFGSIAGWFEGDNTIVLNPRLYNTGSLPDAWGLSIIIHEAMHIEQGPPLTKYKELVAWQIGFRVAESLGHYGEDGIGPYDLERKILNLSLSTDQATIDQFSYYVQQYDYVYWLFFDTLPD